MCVTSAVRVVIMPAVESQPQSCTQAMADISPIPSISAPKSATVSVVAMCPIAVRTTCTITTTITWPGWDSKDLHRHTHEPSGTRCEICSFCLSQANKETAIQNYSAKEGRRLAVLNVSCGEYLCQILQPQK